MKTSIFVLFVSLGIFSSAQADEKSLDPIAVSKGMYTLKAEDADTRIMEVNFKPGEKIPMHQHPKHTVYALTDGVLKIYPEGKEPSVTTLKVGDTVIIPAEKHWAENVGKKPIKLVVTELKGK